MKHLKKQQNGGFALLLAIIVSSVVLAIGLAILDVSVNQINLSATARESEIAFQAAHAGVDCMSYWRNEQAAVYTAIPETSTNPAVTCFGSAPKTKTKARLQRNSAGHVDGYTYQFEWGSPLRCTNVNMYVFNAQAGNVTRAFDRNAAFGTSGIKTCKAGNVCTVVISSGYNRSCAEIGTSIFSVQRELTVEF